MVGPPPSMIRTDGEHMAFARMALTSAMTPTAAPTTVRIRDEDTRRSPQFRRMRSDQDSARNQTKCEREDDQAAERENGGRSSMVSRFMNRPRSQRRNGSEVGHRDRRRG